MNLIWAFSFTRQRLNQWISGISLQYVQHYASFSHTLIFLCLSLSVRQFNAGSQGILILTAPKPFKCEITVRDEQEKGMIEGKFVRAIVTFVAFEEGLDPFEKDWVAKMRTGLLQGGTAPRILYQTSIFRAEVPLFHVM